MKSTLRAIGFVALSTLSSSAAAQAAKSRVPKPVTLGELLKQVKAGRRVQTNEDKQREGVFRASKSKQRQLLKQAQAVLAKEQQRSEAMEKEFDENEVSMARLEETLRIRLGTMGELFGVIRQMAGEARAHLDESLVSAQLPGRGEKLKPLAQSKGLPSVEELEQMWYLLQEEMVQQGKVVRFKAQVLAQGKETERDVIRIGTFNAIADGKYLNWSLPTEERPAKLTALDKQPAARLLAAVEELSGAKTGDDPVRMAVDPTRGQLLSLLVETPTFVERLEYGGVIGYIIIGLALLTLLGGIVRALILVAVGLKVRRQRSRPDVRKNNPLGRILNVYADNPDVPVETLEHKLDEAIIRESAKLERFLWAIKIVSVVAPLLGLLGTVTGMIRTFQSIMLHGAGDPRMMAGGISEALVTTMLGLMTAIPLVLLHSWLKSITKGVIEILEQQSIGIVAKRAEQERASVGAHH